VDAFEGGANFGRSHRSIAASTSASLDHHAN
jgi:hypothetical protein